MDKFDILGDVQPVDEKMIDAFFSSLEKGEHKTEPYPHPDEELLRQTIPNTVKMIEWTKEFIQSQKQHHLDLIQLYEMNMSPKYRAILTKEIAKSLDLIEEQSKYVSTLENWLKQEKEGYIAARLDTAQRRMEYHQKTIY